jgi:hypothetical protein
VLHPTSSLRRLLLWSDYYLRYDETFWAANQLFDYGQQIDTDEVKVDYFLMHHLLRVEWVIGLPRNRHCMHGLSGESPANAIYSKTNGNEDFQVSQPRQQ